MKVTSSAVQNGQIALPYGKFGSEFLKGMPTFSIPFEITEAPVATQSFVVVLDDPDSVPVAGFKWIHWLVANLTRPMMAANESVKINPDFVQGNNSWNVPLYGGMAPPDKPHTYVLTVYALDTLLPLKTGFTMDKLLHLLEGHVLDTATLKGVYPN